MRTLRNLRCLLLISTYWIHIGISESAYAGGGVSGGGNVLACTNESDGKIFYQLLDYFDATKPNGHGFQIDLGPKAGFMDKVDFVLSRMEKFDSYRSRVYRHLANKFDFEKEYSDDDSRLEATDSNDLGGGYFLPSHCKIERVIILRSDEERIVNNNDIHYSILKHVWAQLDETTKAGLLLHEIAYREAISLGAQSSLRTRRFVGYISSKNISKSTYPSEILRANLKVWGEAKYSQWAVPDFNLWPGHALEPYARFTLNSILILRSPTHTGAPEFKLKLAGGTAEPLFLKVDGQESICSRLEFSFFNKTENDMIILFNKILNDSLAQGISDQLLSEERIHIEFVCNTPTRIRSAPSSNPTFDLTFRAGTTVRLFKIGPLGNRIAGFFEVQSGLINGVDVSGKICESATGDGSPNCH
ncbi:MAG: hypothetical protein JNM39_05755 [Bdellovibrionaceae bacterium]|nr:hypothetical protein [Pseudobdellovibrionaceae bacterium]